MKGKFINNEKFLKKFVKPLIVDKGGDGFTLFDITKTLSGELNTFSTMDIRSLCESRLDDLIEKGYVTKGFCEDRGEIYRLTALGAIYAK